MSGYDFRDACEAGDLDKVKGNFTLLLLREVYTATLTTHNSQLRSHQKCGHQRDR